MVLISQMACFGKDPEQQQSHIFSHLGGASSGALVVLHAGCSHGDGGSFKARAATLASRP